jgi:hypothetical protein
MAEKRNSYRQLVGNYYIHNTHTTGERRKLHNKELNDLSTSHPILFG